jgi:hypothetical protein
MFARSPQDDVPLGTDRHPDYGRVLVKTVSVKVEPDYLERLARARKPTLALAELIWNALDADAKRVVVHFERDLAGGPKAIHVSDDGTGITEVDAEGGFGSLGASWKRLNSYTRRDRRVLHGKEGKGRFHAFALGSEVRWTSRSEGLGGLRELTIDAAVDRLGTFRVSDHVPVNEDQKTGTEVIITGVPESVNTLARPGAFDELTEIFAFYLRQYPEVVIDIDGRQLDPVALELHQAEYEIPAFLADGREVTDASLTVVEWRSTTSRSLYLCDPDGFALQAVPVNVRAPGFDFTAYLRSAYIRELYDRNELVVGELHPGVQALHEAARAQIRDHFRHRSAGRATELVEEWKREKIYPYEGEPTSLVERTERQVFEVVAMNVNTYLPDFASADRRNKQFSLQLLRHAIESNPDSMQRILTDVLGLPKQKQDELAELLEKTSLASIISATRVVADRLNFLRVLEAMIYEAEPKKQMLERRQLHRILADHTWLFGEEYHITVDDESLTAVLKKHIKLLGRDELAADARPVRSVDGRQQIVDLMLSRMLKQPKADREHLVIELKRPTQKIDEKVLGQVTKYAMAVAKDERFRDTSTRWVFWAVSNELDDFAEFQTSRKNQPRGMLTEHEELRISIWARSWADIIHACEARLKFYREQLNYTADRTTALAALRKTHEKYFPPALLKDAPAA